MLDVNKIERCKKKLSDQYYSSSVIESTVETIDFSAIHEKLEFQKFGFWTHVPKNWFTDPANYPDHVFSELGRDLALGEKKFIIEQILGDLSIEKEKVATLEFSDLEQTVIDFITKYGMNQEITVFIPIGYFMKVNMEWGFKRGILKIETGELLVCGQKLKIIWSNKYLPFNEVILTVKNFGQWIAKPSVNKRLEVSLFESSTKLGSMELKAQTIFNFKIQNPDQVKVIQPASTPTKNSESK